MCQRQEKSKLSVSMTWRESDLVTGKHSIIDAKAEVVACFFI